MHGPTNVKFTQFNDVISFNPGSQRGLSFKPSNPMLFNCA